MFAYPGYDESAKPQASASQQAPQSWSIAPHLAGLFVLIRKLYVEGAITAEHRARLKDAVLDYDPQLLTSFQQFVVNNDKTAIIDALLAACAPEDDEDVDDGADYYDDDAEEDRVLDEAGRFFVQEEELDDGAQEDIDNLLRMERMTSQDAREMEAIGRAEDVDVAGLRETTQLIGFNELNIEQLWSIFAEELPAGDSIEYVEYERVVRSLATNHVRPRFVFTFLQRLFLLLDRNHDGTVDAGELFAALSMMSCSFIDTKMRFVFNLFDNDRDGYVSNEELFRLVFCASAVMVLTNQASSIVPLLRDPQAADQPIVFALPTDDVWERARETQKLFAKSATSVSDFTTFDEFRQWEDNPFTTFHQLIRPVLWSENAEVVEDEE